ncbi:sensor domain-containing diguanylate cyclase [Marinobacterium stanieri]|uniref:GGDEF domain-containing protein n=1 Tax=Marinobacterium stanieri TaxID=49186 RepID=UPI0002559E12|nr:sensor domain-containing diguanylate cyclase [Marinobacterium stanieri]
MFAKNFLQFNLKHLILLLAFSSAAITLLNSLSASYQVQRKLLIQQSLDSNQVYARKLATSTENFLQASQQQLAVTAEELVPELHNQDKVQAIANRLRRLTESFNSVVIVSAEGEVLATSPEALRIVGHHLQSPGALEALKERKPLISEAYLSAANNLLVFISHPLFAETGEYLGYIGGSIYLKERSILNSLLGTHYYKDGSYLFVVDQNRRLLYHPETERVGERVHDNAVIEQVISGNEGSAQVQNSQGIEMLAGFAPVGSANWGIVAQRPLEATLAPLNSQMHAVIYHTLPLALVTLLLIWWLARLVSRPLWQLADNAQSLDKPCTPERIKRVRSWYFESAELKRAMLLGINLLHTRIGELKNDAETDPLTGLSNRRGSELTLALLQEKQVPFSVLAIDIDHFKQVNDTYGHDCGDEVLKSLAEILKSCTRQEDLACRTGGEEFMILLPNVHLQGAQELAERLRKAVAKYLFAEVGVLTISIGVAEWPEQADEPAKVLKYADHALYRAKKRGRNRTEVYQK